MKHSETDCARLPAPGGPLPATREERRAAYYIYITCFDSGVEDCRTRAGQEGSKGDCDRRERWQQGDGKVQSVIAARDPFAGAHVVPRDKQQRAGRRAEAFDVSWDGCKHYSFWSPGRMLEEMERAKVCERRALM